MNEFDCFISYSSNDIQIIEPIVRDIQTECQVWFDKDQILPGDNIRQKLTMD